LTTRQRTLPDQVDSAEELLELARWLLHHPEPPTRPVRLLGLTVSNFASAAHQLTLRI
jgi:DNA polymerase-4